MDGECAARSPYPACAPRRRAPDGGVSAEGPALPASAPAPPCEGPGKGDRPRPRSWRPGPCPRSAGPPRRRSLARARRSGLAAARCPPSPGPRDPPLSQARAGGAREAGDPKSPAKGGVDPRSPLSPRALASQSGAVCAQQVSGSSGRRLPVLPGPGDSGGR